jgi:hypothetical protein
MADALTQAKAALSQLESLSKILTEYVQMTYTVDTTGFYNKNTGAFSVFAGYQSIKVPCLPRQKLRCAVTIGGINNSMAVFYDQNNVLVSTLNDAINTGGGTYVNYEFVVPNNAYYVAISGSSTKNIKLEQAQTFQLADYTPITYAISNGLYDTTGALKTIADAAFYDNYRNLKVSCLPGDKFRCTCSVGGTTAAMAVFYDVNNALLSTLNVNTGLTYVNEPFVVPVNAYYVAISSASTDPSKLKLEKFIAVKDRITTLEQKSNTWAGKRVVWFGTSIPAGANGIGGAYPKIVADTLGFTLYNESVAGSAAQNYTVSGGAFPYSLYSLATTLAEKQYEIDNWATEQSKFTGAPTTLTTQQQTDILNSSYEIKLVQKYLGVGNRCDLYVFDHGRNDSVVDASVPTDPYDRSKFVGAINFLVKTILTDNPRAKICFISHYETDRFNMLTQCQQTIADYWRFPFLKLWEKLGWSQRTISTTGYWGANGIWVDSGGASQTLTMTQIAMKDDLHPASDNSGKASNLIAGFVKTFIRDLV